jgi:hypothetical protein
MDEVGDIGDVGANEARWRKRRNGVHEPAPAKLSLSRVLGEYCYTVVAVR